MTPSACKKSDAKQKGVTKRAAKKRILRRLYRAGELHDEDSHFVSAS